MQKILDKVGGTSHVRTLFSPWLLIRLGELFSAEIRSRAISPYSSLLSSFNWDLRGNFFVFPPSSIVVEKLLCWVVSRKTAPRPSNPSLNLLLWQFLTLVVAVWDSFVFEICTLHGTLPCLTSIKGNLYSCFLWIQAYRSTFKFIRHEIQSLAFVMHVFIFYFLLLLGILLV